MAQGELVRIVQGALVNVRRHARAANVWVSFAREDNDLHVVVEDDGVGFDVQRVTGNRPAVDARTHAKCGPRVIDSAPGHTTRIRLRVPLETGRRELQLAE